KVLFFSKTIPVDKTYGDAIDIPSQTIELLGELKKELQDERNWQAIQPTGSRLLVSVRAIEPDPEAAPGSLLLHPNSGLQVEQGMIPLETTLEKFGASKIQGAKAFDLAFTRPGDGQ